jgi:hypothetical protein
VERMCKKVEGGSNATGAAAATGVAAPRAAAAAAALAPMTLSSSPSPIPTTMRASLAHSLLLLLFHSTPFGRFFVANRRLHQLSYAASSRCIRMNLEDEGMYSEAMACPN